MCKIFPVFLVIFALLIAPAYISYDKTNDEVYYDMGQCLPEDMEYVIANSKLSEEFDIAQRTCCSWTRPCRRSRCAA